MGTSRLGRDGINRDTTSTFRDLESGKAHNHECSKRICWSSESVSAGKWWRHMWGLELEWLGSGWQGGLWLHLGFTLYKLGLSWPLLLHSVIERKTKGRRWKKVQHRLNLNELRCSRTNVFRWGQKINVWVKVVVTGSLLNSCLLALILNFSCLSHISECFFPITNHWFVNRLCAMFEINSNHANTNTLFCTGNSLQFAKLSIIISFDLYSNLEEYIGFYHYCHLQINSRKVKYSFSVT